MSKIPSGASKTGRELGACESVLWTLDSQLAANAVIRAELTGPLSMDHFREALDRLQAIHPMLRVRVVASGRNRYSFSTDGVPPIPLRWFADKTLDLRTFMEEEFRLAVRDETGPLARIAVVDHGSDRFTAVLTMNHAIIDGLSSYYFMQSLCEQLASTLEPGSPKPIISDLSTPLESRLPRKYMGWRGVSEYVRLVAATMWIWVRTGKPLKLPADRAARPGGRWIGVVTRRLKRGIGDGLPQLARSHGTTVHGILSAALMEAVHKVYNLPDTASVCCASLTNIRTDLDRMSPNEIGLFVSSLPTYHRPGRQGFWELAVDVREKLRSGRQRHHDLLLGPLTNRFLMWLFRRGALGSPEKFVETVENANYGTFAITNLGVLDGDSRWGPVRLTGFNALVSPTVLNPLIVTAMTFDGTLTLNFVHVMPLLSQERANRIAEEVMEIIKTHAQMPARAAA